MEAPIPVQMEQKSLISRLAGSLKICPEKCFCELSVYTMATVVHYWNGNVNKPICFCSENTFYLVFFKSNLWNKYSPAYSLPCVPLAPS